MLRHVAVFVFTPEFGGERLEEWMARLVALEHQVPELRSISVGVDTMGGANSWQVALVADFDDRAGLDAYTRHPKHQEVLEISGPVKERLATVDFEWTP